jgi:protein-tyrosine phosphatase
MHAALYGTLSPEQQARLAEFDAACSVDIHCHCLPGLDDGPADIEQAIALCRALVKDGITTVISTPHQLGRYDRTNNRHAVADAVNELSEQLEQSQIPLKIYPGGDVRVDERLPQLLDAGEIGTAADAGRHLLLELPHELFIDPLPMIDVLRERGLQAIMTHPERHRYLSASGNWTVEWLEHGAVIQITAGSLIGEFGPRAYAQAWQLVRAGFVSIIASDAHDALHRPPRMTEATEVLIHQVGKDTARCLTIENPLRVLNGEIIPPPSIL